MYGPILYRLFHEKHIKRIRGSFYVDTTIIWGGVEFFTPKTIAKFTGTKRGNYYSKQYLFYRWKIWEIYDDGFSVIDTGICGKNF